MNTKDAIVVAERCSQLKWRDPLQATAVALLKEIERLRAELEEMRLVLREVMRWQISTFLLPYETEKRIRIALGQLPPHRKVGNPEPGANDPNVGTGSPKAVGEAVIKQVD